MTDLPFFRKRHLVYEISTPSRFTPQVVFLLDVERQLSVQSWRGTVGPHKSGDVGTGKEKWLLLLRCQRPINGQCAPDARPPEVFKEGSVLAFLHRRIRRPQLAASGCREQSLSSVETDRGECEAVGVRDSGCP